VYERVKMKLEIKTTFMEEGEVIGDLSFRRSESELGEDRMSQLYDNLKFICMGDLRQITLPFGIRLYRSKKSNKKHMKQYKEARLRKEFVLVEEK
jgi:hypothetical protein